MTKNTPKNKKADLLKKELKANNYDEILNNISSRKNKKNREERIHEFQKKKNFELTKKKYFEIGFQKRSKNIRPKQEPLKFSLTCSFFLLKLLLFFIFIQFSENNTNKVNLENSITLTIMGTGVYQAIINELIAMPNQVIINEKNMQTILNNYKLDKCVNTIILKWNSPLETMKNMFYNLVQIYTIDFSKFDSSQVTDMTSMFHGCLNLTSINFDNFNTSLVESMYDMFYSCTSLTSLDVTNFDTSLVTSMSNMFKECISLISIDLSSFDTRNVLTMESMFTNDKSLISLGLSNFNITATKKL
jgi:surface protein